ncbi:DEAD/DEAH box helicase family protein [Candidatus Dojkabacteria bacterium]|nr:DEAD/DEAH box helicase family protein [Candidatus Dojkabacteria bacterium]
MEEQNLRQMIELDLGRKNILKIKLPEYITGNLKHELWYWQTEALQYFIAYDDPEYEYEKPSNEPTHLMFNMATGTGKTLLMAALILYYYKKGYRHYIFFVNQNNIVDKTENNFINKLHIKYEFQQNVVIDNKTISIRKVETFDNSDDIQIKFTSIHKLHNAVYIAKENSVTLEDLQKKDLVLLGDEAHHLNASTIKTGQTDLDLPLELKETASDKDIEKSWENTVLHKILRKGKARQDSENKNVLLEFTATIPNNAGVIEKYRTKTIYRFDLVDFLNAGYTKEINLISTSLKKKEKILLALLFNWYRHQIALKNNIPNFKPVVLFRSKFIEDSKKDYKRFLSLITDLNPTDLGLLKIIEKSIKQDSSAVNKIYEQGKSRVKQMLSYIESENIKVSDIVNYIKDEFTERNCIITNSEDNKATTKEKTTEEQEQFLNSLEDKNNHIRAIFTVKRLTEGWDVLNLFDIVRLYSGRDEGKGQKNGPRVAGSTTVQEVQLIGRGVRYYPFTYNEHEKSKRKFDNELENPLRVLEEFYYHSEDDYRYLDELKRELKNKGLIQDNRVIKRFALKEKFIESNFFREIKIWKNKRINNPEKRKRTLKELQKEFVYEFKTQELAIREQQVVLDKDKDEVLAESALKDSRTLNLRLKDFEKHIITKAININAKKDMSVLRFENLQNELDINSVDEIMDEKFVGNFKINVITSKDAKSINDFSNSEHLDILLGFFDEFTRKLKEIANPFLGSDNFSPFSFEELFGEEKEKSVIIDQESKNLEAELKQRDWYVLNGFNGTREERELMEFIKNKIGNLEEKYDTVYLLRNEEIYKIYDFKQGRGFEPDFLLFLRGKKGSLHYQIFIEPKGSQFADKEGGFTDSKEGWKEEFLQQISDKYGNGTLLKAESKKYTLIGLPMFNKKEENKFGLAFGERLLN